MPSILIVDDLISIHEMLEAVISPTGHKTTFATDGEKGLARYKAVAELFIDYLEKVKGLQPALLGAAFSESAISPT